jgi:hypothetical protein
LSPSRALALSPSTGDYSAQGGTTAEKEYKNVTATPADGRGITWLNTATAPLNPFFVKGALLAVSWFLRC